MIEYEVGQKVLIKTDQSVLSSKDYISYTKNMEEFRGIIGTITEKKSNYFSSTVDENAIYKINISGSWWWHPDWIAPAPGTINNEEVIKYVSSRNET